MRLAALSLLLGLWPNVTIAATFHLPEEHPLATFSLPDAWDPHPSDDGGVEATSPDGFTVVFAQIVESNDLQGATSDNFKSLGKKGLQLDLASGSVTQIAISGHDAFDVAFVGNDGVNKIKIFSKIVSTTQAKKS